MNIVLAVFVLEHVILTFHGSCHVRSVRGREGPQWIEPLIDLYNSGVCTLSEYIVVVLCICSLVCSCLVQFFW